jgi:plasmid replication initiation protein
MSKLDIRVDKEAVLKHDDIVRLGREFGGLKESRFLNCCLVGLDNYNRLADFEYYPVNIQRYADKNGLAYSEAYKEVKEFAIKHMEETLFVKLANGSTWGTPLIYDIEFCDDIKFLKIKWNKEVIPLISGTMENGKFLRYDARMDSTSSNKVYLLSELLQRNLYKLSLRPFAFTLSIMEIREATGTIHSYPEYYELKRNVITPTLKEMAETIGEKLTLVKGNRREVTFVRAKETEPKTLLPTGV